MISVAPLLSSSLELMGLIYFVTSLHKQTEHSVPLPTEVTRVQRSILGLLGVVVLGTY